MKVALLSRYERLGASSRLRSYQYIPFLAGNGIEVEAFPLLPDQYLQRLYAGASRNWGAIASACGKRLGRMLAMEPVDLLWLERELIPFAPAWFEELLLKGTGIPYVVDYDDAVFHDYDRHRSSVVRRVLGKKIDCLMKNAAVVVVGNDYIRQRAVRAGARRVKLVPTAVDLRRYRVKENTTAQPFTIGWMGTPVTTKFLEVASGALREVCAERKGRFVAAGAGPCRMPGVPVEVVAWTEDSEVSTIREFDAGIMPLTGGAQERGKCGYKLIQYMACGLPVVASPVGVNAKLITHGENGFLASNEAEWVTALSRLRDDPALRVRMGAAGRRLVEREYCITATIEELVDLFYSAAAAGTNATRIVSVPPNL